MIQKPIYEHDKPGIVIDSREIEAEAGEVGIELERCPGAIIRNCKVRGGRTCIQVSESDNVLIENNTVGEYASMKTEEGHGIQTRKCRAVRVAGNTVVRWASMSDRNPQPGEGEDGINLWRSSGTVEGNKVYGHGLSTAGNAITIDDGSVNVMVLNNQCWRMGQRGIVAAGGSGHVIRGNAIDGAQDAAIAVQGCYRFQVVQNVRVGVNTYTRLGDKAIYIDPKTTRNVVKEAA